jgi:hypothetical protein
MNGRERNASFARGLLRLLRAVVVGYLIVLALVYVFQRRLQYFPAKGPVPLPPGAGREGLEEVTITAADGTALACWYWPGPRPITLLVLHGNAGHRGDRLEWAERFHALGLGVFLLDYRGYGGSEGSPSEDGLRADAEAACAWLEERGAGRLVYLGESLGSAVAVRLAEARPPAALILQSGFSSMVDVARRIYPFLPVGWLMKDRYECSARIGSISSPLLMIHGEEDREIPPELARPLFDAAREPKEWCLVAGAGHNDLPWVGGSAYYERIDRFLRQHLEEPVPPLQR